jgi:hypothetical protein
MIGRGEAIMGGRMQKVGGVGGFALDAEENIKGGGASGGDRHSS